MDATLVRTRALAAMVVGARGRNALRVVDAFERQRIIVLRADDIATACDRLPVDMPHLVLVFTAIRDDERDALADRATAVGALVVNVDPELDDTTFAELVDRSVRAAIERRLIREQRDSEVRATEVSSDDLDEGWGE